MVQLLAGWKGTVNYNGQEFQNGSEFTADFKPVEGKIHIKLYPQGKKTGNAPAQRVTEANKQEIIQEPEEYVVTVKKYMTQKSSPRFDFMAKWNNDVPMPLCTMVGYRVKETPGMVYMKLHGDIISEKTSHCMKCGKRLTNPVSQYFGIGPECGNHNYVNPFNTEEELRQAVGAYKKKLQEAVWEGWVIKSAIKSEVAYVKKD